MFKKSKTTRNYIFIALAIILLVVAILVYKHKMQYAGLGAGKKKSKKKLRISDVKIGDKVLFDNGREHLIVTITKFNREEGGIDVMFNNIETFLLKSDFANGFVFNV